MSIRIYRLEGGSSTKGVIAGLLFAGAGLLLLFAGIAILITLAVAGTAIGLGVMLYRRLTGRSMLGFPRQATARRPDSSLEVFAENPVVADRTIGELPDSLPPRDTR